MIVITMMMTAIIVTIVAMTMNLVTTRMIAMTKMAIYCPQVSGTLRQQLLMMHGIAWAYIVLHGIAYNEWFCMVLHGIAWYRAA